ncbi:MAG: tetratricopeptide repeat protein [Desulfatirhabdiaceae bacterium]
MHNNNLICPVCCATRRQLDCDGCEYYSDALQYQAFKTKPVSPKHFMAEINEDVFREVDRALIFCKKGSFAEAHTILQSLLPKHPRNHHVCYGMGLYHALQGNDAEALIYLDRATDIFPYFIEAHFNKGTIFRKNNDTKHMINAYQTVIEIGNPEHQTVKEAKDILLMLDQNLREKADTTLDSYLKGMEIFERAFEAMDSKKWELAISRFQQCIRYCPRQPQSYGNMGICYGKLGQKTLALQAFDKALEIDKNYEPAIINRAVVNSLQEGEKLPPDKVESIEYYKEYPQNEKSYIEEISRQRRDALQLR